MNKINAEKLFHTLDSIGITSPFGKREAVVDGSGKVIAAAGFHQGTDYSANGKSIPIYALEDGVVIGRGTDTTGAKFVYVKYPRLGYIGLYYHLAKISVDKGQEVNSNTETGYMGMTGYATGNHLHFEWYKEEEHSKSFNSRIREDFDKYIYPEEAVVEPEVKPEPKPEPKPVAIKAGDMVVVSGIGRASSYGTGARTREFKGRTMKVIAISKGAKYPYACNQYGEGRVSEWAKVTAWFKESDVKKV